MLTEHELRTRYENWDKKLTAYVAEFKPIVTELANRKTKALVAATTYDYDALSYEEIMALHAESDLACFAYDNASLEYCTNWDRMRVLRDAAKYELEETGLAS